MILPRDLDFFKDSCILITGGTGFIGSGLVRVLAESSCKVHVLVRKTSDFWRLKSVLEKITIHEVVLSGDTPLTELLPNLHPDYIFHFAEPSNGHLNSVENFIRIQSESLKMVNNILDFGHIRGVKKIIHACSYMVYGTYSEDKAKESGPYAPATLRGMVKLSERNVCLYHATKFGTPVNLARVFRAYGPYETSNKLIAKTLSNYDQGMKINLVKDAIYRDYIYLDDILLALLKMCKTNLIPGDEFNIGSGSSYTAREIVTFLEKILDSGPLISDRHYPVSEIDMSVREADISKAKGVLDWVPQTDIMHGLSDIVNAWKLLQI